MRRYILGRFGQAIFTLWAAFTLAFFILFLLPGDPVTVMLDARGDGLEASAEEIAALKQRYGLDQPILMQYLLQISRVLQGDLGASIGTGKPVLASLLEALPHTLVLGGLALLVAIWLGAALALTATYTRTAWLQNLLLSLPPIAVSVPTFWIGLVLLQLFSFRWHIFPAMGNEGFLSVILPAVTLSIPTAAGFAQVFARSLQTALDQAYVDTALAKGASRLRVHLRHALPNAALPAVTLIGMSAGSLVGGSVITEAVFSRLGLGRLAEIAVHARDIPMVQGIILLSALIYVVVNLLVDLAYPILDPRIAARRSLKLRTEEG